MLDDTKIEIERLAVELVKAVAGLEDATPEGETLSEEAHYAQLAEKIFTSEYMDGLLARARGGVTMRYQPDGEGWWACPNCQRAVISEDEAMRGKICEVCSEGLIEDELIRHHQETAIIRIIDDLNTTSGHPMFTRPVREWLNLHLNAIRKDGAVSHINAPDFYTALSSLAASVSSAGYAKQIGITLPGGSTHYIPVQGAYEDAAGIIRRGY